MGTPASAAVARACAFIATQSQRFDFRPYIRQASRFTLRGKGRVFREKAVARVHRVATRIPGDFDQLLNVKIGRCPDTIQRNKFVGLASMQCQGIVQRCHADGFDA